MRAHGVLIKVMYPQEDPVVLCGHAGIEMHCGKCTMPQIPALVSVLIGLHVAVDPVGI